MKLRTWVLVGTWILLSVLGGVFGGLEGFAFSMVFSGFFIGIAALFIHVLTED